MKKTPITTVIFSVILFFIGGSAIAEISTLSTQMCKATTSTIYPCVVGKSGIRADKKEGDGVTPAGSFLIRDIFYRPDKLTTD